MLKYLIPENNLKIKFQYFFNFKINATKLLFYDMILNVVNGHFYDITDNETAIDDIDMHLLIL